MEYVAGLDDSRNTSLRAILAIGIAVSVVAFALGVWVYRHALTFPREALYVHVFGLLALAGCAAAPWLVIVSRSHGARVPLGWLGRAGNAFTISPWARRALFVLVFGMVIAWLKYVDVWTTRFAVAGPVYFFYNCARAAFWFFMAVALLGTGRFVLARLQSDGETAGRSSMERMLSAFCLGASVWIILLFIAGLLGLLYWLPAAVLMGAAIWWGYPGVGEPGRDIRERADFDGMGTFSGALATAVLVVALAFIWALAALNGGFAVSGFEYDSSGHYLPYYQQVVENHGTRPNELWYHFWVSKGAGLHFLSIMLTDVQGPQLVSFMFLLAAALCLFVLVRRASRSIPWALLAAVVFSAPFIAYFFYYQKQHLVTTGLVAGILWFASMPAAVRGTRAGAVSLGAISSAAIINTPPLAAVLLPFLGLLFLRDVVVARNERSASRWFLAAPVISAGAAISAILTINYLWTGLGEVTPFKLFLAHADQAKLSRYVSPYLFLMAEEGSSDTTGRLSLDALSSSAFILGRVQGLLRLQAFAPAVVIVLLIILAFILVLALAFRRIRTTIAEPFHAPILFLLAALAVGFLINQPGSIERFYTFAFLPVALLAVGIPAAIAHSIGESGGRSLRELVRYGAIVLVLFLGLVSSAYWIAKFLYIDGRAYLEERIAFLVGKRAYSDALLHVRYRRNEGGWPRRDLSEECLGIAGAVKPATGTRAARPRVWTLTFLQESGCHIIPGARIQMEFSVAFGNRWHEIVFGEAAAARRELERLGIRYFYINLADFDMKRLEAISTSIFGCLAYSPLFSMEHLSERFRIVWRRGDAVLLELAPAGRGEPLSEEFLRAWRTKVYAVQHGLGDMPGLCNRLSGYYRSHAENWPVAADPALPKLKGWQ